MTEIWDVYNEKGEKTGRTMQRGIPAEGEYMLCVHIYLHTPDGRFLMQKRSAKKESHPGEWDVTVGAVLCGEESIDGAKRELLEEVGIDISDAKIVYIGRHKKKQKFSDIYFVEKEFSLSDCVLQEEEVDEVCLVDGKRLLQKQECERHRDRSYMELLQRAVSQLVFTGQEK